ncbi:hypothetical protein K439DRAFT_1543481 [Ramaria rubella]|nr:hypothetical protein K439DRAFT_1543481 [Ramaria rubella]
MAAWRRGRGMVQQQHDWCGGRGGGDIGWRWGPLGGEWQWGHEDQVVVGAARMGMAAWMWWVVAGTVVGDGGGVCGCGGGWEEGGGGASVTAHVVVRWRCGGGWRQWGARAVAGGEEGEAVRMGMVADEVGGGGDCGGGWRWGVSAGVVVVVSADVVAGGGGGNGCAVVATWWWGCWWCGDVGGGGVWWWWGGGGGGGAWATFVTWCVTTSTGSRSEVVTTMSQL